MFVYIVPLDRQGINPCLMASPGFNLNPSTGISRGRNGILHLLRVILVGG